MRSIKSIWLLSMFLVYGLFFGCVPKISAANVTVGQTASKASPTYFYYSPGARDAYAVINNAINAAASGATVLNRGVVLIENAESPYEVEGHILAKSNVDIIGESRDGVKLKIASGIIPVAYGGPGTIGWGGVDSASAEGAIINVWYDIVNVKIANITLDGSCGDYYACEANDRGHAEFPLINVYKAPNVLIDNVKFTQGMGDGIIARGNDMEVSNSIFDMVGHDFVNGYNINNLKFHHNVGAMRTNTGVRFSGAGSGCYVYDNEFYTGSGGASAIELQNTASNVKVYNNYFHDISGASGMYGAIGYVGQTPTGTGHEYYDNLFVNMPYAVSYVPSTAVSRNNIMINCSVTVGKGADIDNIKTTVNYVFAQYGTDRAGDTYWTVSSGPLFSVFSGIKVGIESGPAGGTGGDSAATEYALTVNEGTGSGYFSEGTEVTVVANPPTEGQVFDQWTGDTSFISSVYASTALVTMPAQAMSLFATYKDIPVVTYALTVSDGSGSGSYVSGAAITIAANAPMTGKIFDKWIGDTSHVSNIYDSVATVIMPDFAITLTATYKNLPTYALTVNGGTGSGFYISGKQIVVTANPPTRGKIFSKWIGDTSYVSNIYSPTATVTMPAKAIILTATYKRK